MTYAVTYDKGKHRIIALKDGKFRKFNKKVNANKFKATLKGNPRVVKFK